MVALLLAGVGLYGVLDYLVLQRRREISIRMAVGAQAGDIAQRVIAQAVALVAAGACAGLSLGVLSAHYLETLLFQTKATDAAVLAMPSCAMLVTVLLAAFAPVIRAVRIDLAAVLRTD